MAVLLVSNGPIRTRHAASGSGRGGRTATSSSTTTGQPRVWRTRSQLELAIVQYVGWFNDRRLHGALGDIPPAEAELEHALAAPSAPARTDGCRSTVAPRASAPRSRPTPHRPVNQVTRPPSDPVRLSDHPIPHPGNPALVSGASAPQPTPHSGLGADEPPREPMAPTGPTGPSLP
jgi:hypothetical protein